MNKDIRKKWVDQNFDKIIRQHQPGRIKMWLKDVFDFTDVKYGNIEKGEGDIVIINLKPSYDHGISFSEYFRHTHWVDRIETKGIFTNIFWKDSFFRKSILFIADSSN